MLIFPLNTWQLILSIMLYTGLFVQGYMLIKFVKKNTLLHEGVADKLKMLLNIFTIMLIVKLAFSIAAIKGVNITRPINQTDAYVNGYYTGYYIEQYGKTLLMVVLQNIDQIFVITFIWMLIFVFKEAIHLKKEQELTI